MSLDMFTETNLPDEEYDADSTPVVENDNPCKKCGRVIDVPYGGRGPHPKFCSNCKSASKGTTRSKGPGTKGNAATLAGQAVEALWQINGMGALIAMIAGFHGTAQAIRDREDVFRQMAYDALVTDPDMCRVILRGGVQSSKLTLIMCYGMFAAGIGPVFLMELKAKKEAKLALQEEEERTANLYAVS